MLKMLIDNNMLYVENGENVNHHQSGNDYDDKKLPITQMTNIETQFIYCNICLNFVGPGQ